MFTEPVVISDENTSNHITTDDNRSSFSVSVDDEYSTSSNSNDNEITFFETKLEKVCSKICIVFVRHYIFFTSRSNMMKILCHI